MSIGEAAAQDMTKPTLNLPWDCRNLAVRPRTRDVPAETGFSPAIYIYIYIYEYMIIWHGKTLPLRKKTCFFWGGVVLFAYSFSNRYASAANKIPTFLAILRTRRSFAATLWPWLLFGSTFSSNKNIEKVMPCDLKGVIHSTCFKFQCVHVRDDPWKPQQKGGASNVSNFGSQSLWAPVYSKRIPFQETDAQQASFSTLHHRGHGWHHHCHLSHPSIEKNRGIAWKMSPRNKKNPTERQNVVTYIFYKHSHPPCRTPFPFPSNILLKSLLEHRLDA